MFSQSSQSSQRKKFTAPFLSPAIGIPARPQPFEPECQQISRSNIVRKDSKKKAKEYLENLPTRSPKRKLYTFKEPLQTIEVSSTRVKRYLIPPVTNKICKLQSDVHELRTNAVTLVSPERQEAEVVKTTRRVQPEKKQNDSRKSTYNKRKARLAVLCSVLKMKNELEIIRERREKIWDKTRDNHQEEE